MSNYQNNNSGTDTISFPRKCIGTISGISKNGDFGFINYDETERIFFHFNNAIEPLTIGDKVLFSRRSSKQHEHKLEAIRLRKIYKQESSLGLVLSDRIAFTTTGVKDKLLELISEIKISSPVNEPLAEEIIEYSFDSPVGKSYVCSTTIDDDVFYAKRKNKNGYTRFVIEKEPIDSNVFTVIIRYRDGFHQVVASYFGPRTPAEPWDSVATPDALEFWRTHALIPSGFNYDEKSVRDFDPDFFKSFEEIQANPSSNNG